MFVSRMDGTRVFPNLRVIEVRPRLDLHAQQENLASETQ